MIGVPKRDTRSLETLPMHRASVATKQALGVLPAIRVLEGLGFRA